MRLDGSRLRALRVVGSSQAGVWATVGEQVQRWLSQDNRKKDSSVGSHSAFGIGLPMSNIYATYFGGSLELVSLDGWGTDAYLRLPKMVGHFRSIVSSFNFEFG
jgi:pyruvate dehydrogenase kinase 2/3/4